MRMTIARFLLAAAGTTAIAGCAPLMTQSPGKGLSPVNAISEGDDKHLMLFGYDVVAYFTDRKDVKGSPSIKSLYKDVTFRFATAEHRDLFAQSPANYAPAFGGYCGYAASVGKLMP